MAFDPSLWGRGVLLTGLTPSASLSGYVALVSLDNIPTEAIDAGSNSALNGGGDLRFSTDINGVNQLPLEVVSYVTSATPASRSCQLWIRFPTYASGAREVYMFYNRAGQTQPPVTDTFGRNSVWVDYEGVFHLDETVNNSPGGYVDSTGNQDGTGSSMSIPASSGQIGNGQNFDGSSDLIAINGTEVGNSSAFTISAWINTTVMQRGDVFSEGNSGDANPLIRVAVNENSGTEDNVSFDIRDNSGTSGKITSADVNVTDGSNHYVIAEQRGKSDRELYFDDISIGTNTNTVGTLTLNRQTIGALVRTSTALYYNGLVDELRFMTSTRTDDQKTSEYDNQSNPATFWTTGTPFTPTPSGNTLDAESGAYTYIGTDLTLTADRLLTADSGNYSYSGTDAALLKGSLLVSESGTYVYNGTDVTLIYTPAGSFILPAGSGNYAYTGTDINFLQDRVIIASTGTYTYNGSDISIILPGQIWTDKPKVSTNWTDQAKVTTIWTDK